MEVKTIILDEKAIERATTRIANEIIERNKGAENLVIIGIKTRGYPFALRIAKKIKSIENVDIEVYPLDITFYRDDLKKEFIDPKIMEDFNGNINGKTVILVDDVIYTGRTVRAGLDALLDKGRPSRVQLAALVDRGHRELPIRGDYIGKNLPTSKSENVKVRLREVDGVDQVVIIEK